MSYLSANPECSLKTHDEMTHLKPDKTVAFTPFSYQFLNPETMDILTHGLIISSDTQSSESMRFPTLDGDHLHNNINAIGLFDACHDFNKPDNNRCVDRSTKHGGDVFLNKFTFSFLRKHAYELDFQVSEYLSNFDTFSSILPAPVLENYFALGQMFEVGKRVGQDELYICPNIHDYMIAHKEQDKLVYYPTQEGSQKLLNHIITIFSQKGWVDMKQRGLFIVVDTQKNFYKVMKTVENTGKNLSDNSDISIKLLLTQENINDPANVSNIDTAYDRFGNVDERIFIEKNGQTRNYYVKSKQAIQGKFDCRFAGMQITEPKDLLHGKIKTTMMLFNGDEPVETLVDITMNESPHRNNIASLSAEIEKEEKKTPSAIPILKMTTEYKQHNDRRIYEIESLQHKIDANVDGMDTTEEMNKIDFYIRNFSRKRYGDVLQGESCNEINKGNSIEFYSVKQTATTADSNVMNYELNDTSPIIPGSAVLVTIDRMLFAYALKKRIPCILDTEQHMILFAPQNTFAKPITEEEYNILSEEEKRGVSFTAFLANPDDVHYKSVMSTIRKKQGDIESQTRREAALQVEKEALRIKEEKKSLFDSYPQHIKDLIASKEDGLFKKAQLVKDIAKKEATLKKLNKAKAQEEGNLNNADDKEHSNRASTLAKTSRTTSANVEDKTATIQKTVDSITAMNHYLTTEVNAKLDVFEQTIQYELANIGKKGVKKIPIITISPFKDFVKSSPASGVASLTSDKKQRETEAKLRLKEIKAEEKAAAALKKATKKGGDSMTGGSTLEEIAKFIFSNPGSFFSILPFLQNVFRHKTGFMREQFSKLYHELENVLHSQSITLERHISDCYLLTSNNENVKMFYIANEEKISDLLLEDEEFIQSANFKTAPRTFIAVFNDNNDLLLEVQNTIESGEPVKVIRMVRAGKDDFLIGITVGDIEELIGEKHILTDDDNVRGGARPISNVIQQFVAFFNSDLRTNINTTELKIRNIHVITTVLDLFSQYEVSLLLNPDTGAMVYNDTITGYQIPHERLIYLFLNNIVTSFHENTAETIQYHLFESCLYEYKDKNPLFRQFQDIKTRILGEHYYVFQKRGEIPQDTRAFFRKIIEDTIQTAFQAEFEYYKYTKDENSYLLFEFMNTYHLRNYGFTDIGFDFFIKTSDMIKLPPIPVSLPKISNRLPPVPPRNRFMPPDRFKRTSIRVGGSTRKRRVTKRSKNKTQKHTRRRTRKRI